MLVAGIDCGTNSIRLLISDVDPVSGAATDVYRTMKTVRLGEGVDSTRQFAPAALERTFRACREYQETIAEHNVTGVRFVATSASRDAANRDLFINGVQEILGVTPEVISGDEEAQLTFAGALATHRQAVGSRRALVVDIGGGSTEFVLGDESGKVVQARSVDIGCVRMTERHLLSDPPSGPQIAAATADIDAAIALAGESVAFDQAEVLIGVAGSVTTVAAMAMDLPAYDADQIDGSLLTAQQVDRISCELLAMTRQERAALGFMHTGRVDVIGGGALVLDRIVRATGLPVLVSEHDILDGIANSIAAQ